MKRLPCTLEAYRRTPEFTNESIPSKLTEVHSTKRGVWGRIIVLEGKLLYRILSGPCREFILDVSNPGVIEPEIEHEVEPLETVRFFIEFYRQL